MKAQTVPDTSGTSPAMTAATGDGFRKAREDGRKRPYGLPILQPVSVRNSGVSISSIV